MKNQLRPLNTTEGRKYFISQHTQHILVDRYKVTDHRDNERKPADATLKATLSRIFYMNRFRNWIEHTHTMAKL